jgi:hypothetical protein
VTVDDNLCPGGGRGELLLFLGKPERFNITYTEQV